MDQLDCNWSMLAKLPKWSTLTLDLTIIEKLSTLKEQTVFEISQMVELSARYDSYYFPNVSTGGNSTSLPISIFQS